MGPNPRIEIDLFKIFYNAKTLVGRLAKKGISVTGVTKASLGSPEIAAAFVRAGIESIGESRVENIERIKSAGVKAKTCLIRSPMMSQANQVVRSADMSLNSETQVIRSLSSAAQQFGRMHEVVLMIELGDLREGIMPSNVLKTVREISRFRNIALKGIGTNLACRHGVMPDADKMESLSCLADEIEKAFGLELEIVSGGNSANLDWAFSGARIGRINNLRLGEAILLGVEPLGRTPIEGLYTDAFSFVAEVIESKVKPSLPQGSRGQNAVGKTVAVEDRGSVPQSILAVGLQDTDVSGLTPLSSGQILGASCDHLIFESYCLVGTEIRFRPNYSALMRIMSSDSVVRCFSEELGAAPNAA
jgi:predicted amino acid racemase